MNSNPSSIFEVGYFQRAAGVAFSIERLFDNVRANLPADIVPRIYQVPHAGPAPLTVLRNCFWANKRGTQINHVTGDAYYLALALPTRNTVLTIHDCVALYRLRGVRKLFFYWVWFCLPCRRVNRVTVISEAAKQELLSCVRIPADRIQVIPNCVGDAYQSDPKGPMPERPTLLQIGTKPNKNLANVCRALRGMSVNLRVIGRLTDQDRSLLAQSGIAFSAAAGVSDAQMLEEYKVCDALIFASTYEGFGMPIIEAQAVGRPVVTSAVSPMADVAGADACLVDPHDPKSIRDGVHRILSDAAYREALVSRGFENVRQYRSNVVAEQYASLYRELWGAKKREYACRVSPT